MPMPHPLCHFEFMTEDPDRTRKFYAGVFGWEFDDRSMPGYTLIKTGQDPGGGVMKRPENCPHPMMQVYFMVDDIEATLKNVGEAGGSVIVPKTPIPNVGHFAIFNDPDGIAVGIFQQ
jgi:predicted enzyme related to lactoylglutathione lyase